MATSRKPNALLRRQRELRGWSQKRVADELEQRFEGSGATARDVGRWERGTRTPGPFYREKLCFLYGCTSDQLGFIDPVPGEEQRASPSIVPVKGQQIRELGDIMANRFDPTRRLLFQMLGLAGASAASTPAMLNPELWNRLSSVLVKPSRIDEPTLLHLEQLNGVCWNLSNDSQLELVEQILPAYLPKVTALAHHSSSFQSRAAALAARGYILAAEVDKANVIAMQAYARQAVFYSEFAADDNVHVDALRQEATIALVAKHPLKALQTYKKALPLLGNVSPLLRSRIYLGLASASARCGQKQDALMYLALAHEHFPDKPAGDPNFLYMYTSGSESVLHLYDALTYNDLRQPKDAWKALMQVDGANPKMPVLESARIEFLNLQAKTASLLGNMEESCTYLQLGVDAADAAGYSIWREEAAEVYREILNLWPHEPQVKLLSNLFRREA